MKQPFKILIATAIIFNFQLSTLNSAYAQFAGEDKKVAREPGNTQRVDIGTPDAANDICYMWTGPHIEGNANQAVITVNPFDSVETYNVKRISRNGIEEDQVKVFVEDTIAIVSVFKKYRCYNHGDVVAPDQFEITTDPPGYESLVTVSPNKVYNHAGLSMEDIPVTLSLTKNGHTSTKVVNVAVYNSDLTVSQALNIGALSKYKEALESMALVEYILGHIEEFADVAVKNAPTPCSWKTEKPQGSTSTAIEITPKMLCCSDHTPAPALQIKFGQKSYGNSFSCRFPFYGIPHVASADIVFGLAGSVSIGPVDGIVSTNTECAQICVPVTLSVSVNGGVGVSVGGNILTADLLLQGTTFAQAALCYGTSSYLKVGLTISVVGAVTLASLIEYSIEFPMATYTKTIPLN